MSGRFSSYSDLGDVQANIAKVRNFSYDKARDWSLFLFFRIMRDSEVSTIERVAANLRDALEKLSNLDPEVDEQAQPKSSKYEPAYEFLQNVALGAVANLTSPQIHDSLRFAQSTEKDPDLSEVLNAFARDGSEENAGNTPDPNLPEEMRKAARPTRNFFKWLANVSGTKIEQDTGDGSESDNSESSYDAAEKKRMAGFRQEFLGRMKQTQTGQGEVSAVDDRNFDEEIIELLLKPDMSTANKVLGIEALLFELLLTVFHNLSNFRLLLSVLKSLEEQAAKDKELETIPLMVFILFSQKLRALISLPEFMEGLIKALGDTPEDAGLTALYGGLPLTLLYEFSRQMASKQYLKSGLSVLRNERTETVNSKATNDPSLHPYPINTAFTYNGLKALQLIHPDTLASYPAAFKEGMAARADFLGDTGVSAPTNWEGELGSSHVHGYINTSFAAGKGKHLIDEEVWKVLRSQILAFNQHDAENGILLRRLFGALLPVFGIELLHVELGEFPYEEPGKGKGTTPKAADPKRRIEHFGFRDGISQPFVDMGLGDTEPGGGTPDRNRGWQIVAPGEIFLGHPDEEGATHLEPINSELRDNGTFLVFRKLEQDVAGFRNFLKQQRRDEKEQDKLAAQMMGRWKSGVSLVDSPHSDGDPDNVKVTGFNDFLYAKDDPEGRKCPLGSHVRRANPRDTGGGADVRRHRLLRRSISYGGPLLSKDSSGDGKARGLLFVAANSRIEQQFEVIQAAWLNNSEFLGQAGLGKCPVTGNNKATTFDIFHEAHAPVPVTHVPSFVTMKGGDYFFAPSVLALHKISQAGLNAGRIDDIFVPDNNDRVPDYYVGLARTPVLFEPARIKNYVRRLADRKSDVISVGLQELTNFVSFPHPHEPSETEPDSGNKVVFVGRHEDVHQVLGGVPNSQNNEAFTVPHYRRVAERVLWGGVIPVATDYSNDQSAEERERLHWTLATAWRHANDKYSLSENIKIVAGNRQEKAIRSAKKVGRIDLVHDLATRSVYDVIRYCYGVPGPNWLTELAHSLPFARKHIGEIHPDWMAAISGAKVYDQPQTTLQIWSILFFADLITNVKSQQELHDLGMQAGSEFLTHLNGLIQQARERGKSDNPTLLDAFVVDEVMDAYLNKYSNISEDQYFREVAAILLELTAATMLNIPAIFGKVMDFVLTNRMDLTTLLPILELNAKSQQEKDNALDRIIMESDRLNPAFGLFLRHCNKDIELAGTKQCLKKGDWALALVNAANLDHIKFPDRLVFSLDPALPGPKRVLDRYMLFGAYPETTPSSDPKEKSFSDEHRFCRGRDYIALMMLRQLIRHLKDLHGLRRVPGPQGEIQDLLRVPISLNVKFTRQ